MSQAYYAYASLAYLITLQHAIITRDDRSMQVICATPLPCERIRSIHEYHS